MAISPEAKFPRVQMLRSVFDQLQIRYQKLNRKIAWSTRQDEVLINLDRLWDRYVQDLEDVRRWLMEDANNKVDRHKVIALTQYDILELQPLVLTDAVSADENYRLNVNFAYLFGLQFLTRCNEIYYRAPFYTKVFLHPITHTEAGQAFQHEHYKLLMRHSEQPIALFWCSQLWFALEQWGLTYMEQTMKYHTNPNQ
jgi:hypothetical protein